MKNSKFIVYNRTKSYYDWEVFEFIKEIMQEGLLSNNETEYCYCTVRQHETFEIVCVFNKTKNNYRIDVYEKGRNK